MEATPRRIGRLTLLIIALTVVAALGAWFVSYRAAHQQLEAQLVQTLILTSRNITSEIDRFRYLPKVIGEDERIRSLIDTPTDDASRDRAERYLETVARETGASYLYLLDDTGLALAASNWQEPTAFTGNNYGFRPYFLEAMARGSGRIYAIGVTTGLPGYFLAERISLVSGRTAVVVAKVELSSLERAWRDADAAIAIADGDGIVFLAGPLAWKHRSLQPLSADTVARVSSLRTYEGVDLSASVPMFETATERSGPPTQISFRPFGNSQLMAMQAVPGERWTMLAALDSKRLLATARFWTTIAGLSGLLLAGITHLLLQRQQLAQLRLDQQETLERKVAERTRDLAREIQTRVQTEAALRKAQEGLVHAEKMVALGRMSAAIVHEISQPLAAMDNTIASAELHAGRGDTERLEGRLVAARGLVDRMRRIVTQLRAFSRRDAHVLEAVDCDACIRNALELAAPRLAAMGVTAKLCTQGTNQPVQAVSLKLEQILLNLVLNALDALEGQKEPQLSICRATGVNQLTISVTDNGQGIEPGLLEQVKEPFFTTRQTGEGLGLGLAISSAMAQEFGGAVSLQPASGGGVVATLSLPLRKPEPADPTSIEEENT